MNAKAPVGRQGLQISPVDTCLAFLAFVGLLWAYWPTLGELVNRWGGESQYSHGFLVPLIAILILWAKKGDAPSGMQRGTSWGLLLILMGLALRFLSIYIYFDWLSAASLVPCLAGVVLLAGGWKVLSWSWAAIAFLVFMVPLPHQVQVGLAYPLQRIATICSTYVLQTIGFNAYAEGNVIRMGDIHIGVVEACSGLSMLLTFFTLSTAVVLLAQRTALEKVIIFLSAVPIAVVSNVARIVVAGILFRTVGQEAGQQFHDSILAGTFMIAVALLLLWIELRLLSWVFREPSNSAQASMAMIGVPTALTQRKTRKALPTDKPTPATPRPVTRAKP